MSRLNPKCAKAAVWFRELQKVGNRSAHKAHVVRRRHEAVSMATSPRRMAHRLAVLRTENSDTSAPGTGPDQREESLPISLPKSVPTTPK